jgi:hypothetical protein
MKEVALVVMLVVVVAVGGAFVRLAIRRYRRIRSLERAETSVAAAVADGRMSTVTGQALLQHLEGLRRVSRAGEG